jgi:hypothetical protein
MPKFDDMPTLPAGIHPIPPPMKFHVTVDMIEHVKRRATSAKYAMLYGVPEVVAEGVSYDWDYDFFDTFEEAQQSARDVDGVVIGI